MDGLSTENLFRPFEPAGPGADPYCAQEGKIEFRVEPAVEVSAGLWDPTLSFESPEMLTCASEPSSRFTDMDRILHRP